MTRNREIERVLDEWFAEGPTQMPDRLFDVVVDRIDRTPQRRLARLQTRLLTMNSNIRLAAAAAVVVIVAGAGAFLLARAPAVGTGPSPTPALSPSPQTSPSPLPAALNYTWVGATRTVAEITPPITRSVLKLTGRTMSFVGGGSNALLFSTAGLTSPDSIAFTLSVAGNGCHIGDVGTYTYTLGGSTGGGGTMSLQTVADTCTARAAAISGNWVRSACLDIKGWCLGNLDPGTYDSMSFNPFVPPKAWTSNYGALSYTVPAGWANIEDCDYCFKLAKQNGPPDPPGIIMFSDVAAHSQDAACPAVPEPGIGRTPTELANWLKALPGLIATSPVPITVGGLRGMMLDISVAPTWRRQCPSFSGYDAVETFTIGDSGSGLDWNVAGTIRERVILLDSGGGRSLLIEIDAPDKAAFDVLVAESMPVIQSFQFKP